MKTIHQLKEERARLVERRQDVTASLTELKQQKPVLSPHVYSSQHSALAATDARLSQQITDLNRQVKAAHMTEHPTWTENGAGKPEYSPPTVAGILATLPPAPMETKEERRALIEDIRALRDHYETMSSDRTRLPSIRTMGGEFTKELSNIIRRHIKP